MTHFHNIRKNGVGFMAVLLVSLMWFSTADAQQRSLSPTQTLESVGTDADREAIINRFTLDELNTLQSISPELIRSFDVQELEVILGYNNKTINTPTFAEQQVIDRLNEVLRARYNRSFNDAALMDADVRLSEDFSDGIPESWTVSDDSGEGFLWVPNNGSLDDDYDNYAIIDSDDAGSGIDVATSMATSAIDISGLEEVSLFLSHDYRHLGDQSGTIEWSLDNESWDVLATYDSNARFAEETFDLTEAVAGNDELYLRFVFDDSGAWAWWWAIDEIMVGDSFGDDNGETPGEGYVYNIDEIGLSGASFISITGEDGFEGTLSDILADFTIIDAVGGTWSNDFAILVTDSPNLNEAELLLQVGGLSDFGAAENISWDGGSFDDPINETITLGDAIEFEDGYTVWVGNGWASETSEGTWSGSLEFVSIEGEGTPPIEFADLQIIHNAADPALEMVDIYLNGGLFAEGVAFRDATPYLQVFAGSAINVEITAPGSTDALLELDVTPEADQTYAVVAQGVADPSGFAPNPNGNDIAAELVVLSDLRTAAAEDTNFDFYVYHGATDAPAVDIYVRELESVVLAGAEYGDVSDYFELPAAEYEIEVRAAGTEDVVALFIADTSELGGVSAGMFASGFLNPSDNMDGEGLVLNVVAANGTTMALVPQIGPSLAVTPAGDIDFGNVVEGFTNTLDVTLTNVGTLNLAILNVEIDGEAFTIDYDQALLLAPGESEVFSATFAPETTGDFTAELMISSNDSDSPETITLTGTGVLAPEFATEPDVIAATLGIEETTGVELSIVNDGDGELEFSFPDYIMERILNGNDTQMDAIRDQMSVQVRSAFDNTEEARNATMNRVAANLEAGDSIVPAASNLVRSDNEASLMNEDGFLIEFDGLTLDGGNFITVTDGLSGELTAVAADFVIDAASGGTWANDFGILFTTEELDGGTIDPETVMLQVGGLTAYGPTGTRIAWGTGGSGAPGTPINVTIDIPTPLDVSDLYVSIGHAWTPGGSSTWSGSVNLIGTTEGSGFITEVSPATGTVPAGGTEVVTVTLDSEGLIGGVYESALNILTNDPLNLSVNIPAELTVVGIPELVTDPMDLDFGTVVVGTESTSMFTVSNTGTDVLFVTGFNTGNSQFSVDTAPFDLEVGESAEVMVTYSPEEVGSATATLTIESNDDDATVGLSGEGAEPGILVFGPSPLTVEVTPGSNGTAVFTMSNQGVSAFDYNLSSGLVEDGARMLTPGGSVTEVTVPEAELQRGSASATAELDYNTSAPSGLEGRGAATDEVEFPFVDRGTLDDELVLTHSASQEVEALNGVRCGSTATAQNSYFRTYTLTDFDIDSGFEVTAVQFGLESITGSLPVEARIYTLEGDFVLENLTLIGTSAPVTVDGSLNETVVTIPVDAEIEAGATIVVEAFVAEQATADLFPGTNSAGETSPSYIVGPACEINQPTTYGSIGFPDVHLVLNVVGQDVESGLFVFDSSQGTIEPGQTVEVVGEAQTEEFEIGSYNGNILIQTNSPLTPLGVIPVSIEVAEQEDDSEMVTFQVNMNVQGELDNFRPELGDAVYAMGPFNDWSAIEGQEMTEEIEGEYSITLEVFGEAGDVVEYKYFIEAGDGRELDNGGWESNEVGEGDTDNRMFELIGEDQQLPIVFFNNQIDVSLDPDGDLPAEFALNQNYPNPFNPTTSIQYALPETSEVTLEVFNLQGQRVAVLVNGQQTAGTHTVTFDANRLASGMYLYRIQAGSFSQVEKMMLVK